MKRILFALVFAMGALMASGHEVPVAHAVNGILHWYNPNNSLGGYMGVGGSFIYNNDPPNNYVEDFQNACAVSLFGGFHEVSCQSNTTNNGYPVVTYWANYLAQDNLNQQFSCNPRFLAYSFGVAYDFWDTGQPDSRCADFSVNHNGTGSSCHSDHWIIEPRLTNMYDPYGNYFGTIHVSFQAFYDNAHSCVVLKYQSYSANVGSQIWIQNQLTGLFQQGGSIIPYVEGGAGGGDPGDVSFMQQYNCNSVNCGQVNTYVYVRYKLSQNGTILLAKFLLKIDKLGEVTWTQS